MLTGLISMILLSGLFYRFFSSQPIPPGKLVDINGTKLHVRIEGPKNDLPTIILESGAGNDTDIFHWIIQDLKKNFRIVRYDREGKWFSESSKDNITPEYYAQQLYGLLQKSGEKPPYIMIGHSMGGIYNRIFRDLYPNDVKAMVFIDSSHPDQWNRLMENGLLNKNQINLMKTIAFLSDIGIMGAYNAVIKPKSKTSGLPEECNIRKRKLTYHSGKVYRRYLKEYMINNDVLLRASQTAELDSLPILVFTAKQQHGKREIWFEMQKELKELSSRGKQFYINANHGSILTEKKNSDIIIKELLTMVKTIH